MVANAIENIQRLTWVICPDCGQLREDVKAGRFPCGIQSWWWVISDTQLNTSFLHKTICNIHPNQVDLNNSKRRWSIRNTCWNKYALMVVQQRRGSWELEPDFQDKCYLIKIIVSNFADTPPSDMMRFCCQMWRDPSSKDPLPGLVKLRNYTAWHWRVWHDGMDAFIHMLECLHGVLGYSIMQHDTVCHDQAVKVLHYPWYQVKSQSSQRFDRSNLFPLQEGGGAIEQHNHRILATLWGCSAFDAHWCNTSTCALLLFFNALSRRRSSSFATDRSSSPNSSRLFVSAFDLQTLPTWDSPIHTDWLRGEVLRL